MTPEEIRAALEICRLGQKEFSDTWTTYDKRTVRRWCSGDAVMPADEAEWLRGLAEWHRKHPYPKYRPQGRGGIGTRNDKSRSDRALRSVAED